MANSVRKPALSQYIPEEIQYFIHQQSNKVGKQAWERVAPVFTDKHMFEDMWKKLTRYPISNLYHFAHGITLLPFYSTTIDYHIAQEERAEKLQSLESQLYKIRNTFHGIIDNQDNLQTCVNEWEEIIEYVKEEIIAHQNRLKALEPV